MARVIKMCDMPVAIAVRVFESLNPEKVKVNVNPLTDSATITTDTEPKDLVYPEGWYYAKGCFRNKHTSTTGLYSEIEMLTKSNIGWREKATYCTL